MEQITVLWVFCDSYPDRCVCFTQDSQSFAQMTQKWYSKIFQAASSHVDLN